MIFPNIKVQPYWLKTLEAAADAPVVLPEPDAYLYTSGNHRGVSLEWRGQSDMAEGTERHALYTEQQVRALLAGVFAAAAQGMCNGTSIAAGLQSFQMLPLHLIT